MVKTSKTETSTPAADASTPATTPETVLAADISVTGSIISAGEAAPVAETPTDETTPVADTSTAEPDVEAQATEIATPAAVGVASAKAVTHVVVYCNLPSGLSFRLPDGRKLTFQGYPVSRLVGADGQALPAGKFGKTRNVRVEDWEYIARTYAGCGYFQRTNPLLFAHPSEAEGDVIARELGETRSGLEQVDVRAAGGQTSPVEA